MLALCNTPFYSFHLPLSNPFGIFRFELIVIDFMTETLECQVEKNEHFLHPFLYEFNPGSKAVQATQNISAIYGEDSIAERTAQKWFACFKQGNFDMSDTPRWGQPSDHLVGHGRDYPL
jgi:hypothetical protein